MRVAGSAAMQHGNLFCHRAGRIWVGALSASVWTVPFVAAVVAAVGVLLTGMLRHPIPTGAAALVAAMPPTESLPVHADLLRLLEQRGKLGILFASLCRASASSAIRQQGPAGEVYGITLAHSEHSCAILAQGLVPLRPHPEREDLALWRLCAHNVLRVESVGETLTLVPADVTAYQQYLRSFWQSSGIRLGELWFALKSDRVVVEEAKP